LLPRFIVIVIVAVAWLRIIWTALTSAPAAMHDCPGKSAPQVVVGATGMSCAVSDEGVICCG